MTTEEANKLTDELFLECKRILKEKGADYAGDNDVHDNFIRNAARLGLTKYQVWALYFNKHVDAINNSIKRNPIFPQVESEPLRGRVVDAINYLIRFESMLFEDESVESYHYQAPELKDEGETDIEWDIDESSDQT